MTAVAFLDFLRRELAPTPGRGSATFRLTLACLIATIPILTHRIPHALVVMIVMYLITQEDTAATLLGSILAVAGVTLGLGAALLAWMVALDIAWLRIACLVAFLFVGLFLKRVLVLGALGSAIGVPAALAMIIPDLAPLPPESLVEFVLWLWLCVALGLAVNLGVQLLLSPGDPLTLLQRELDTRLLAVEDAARRMGAVGDLTPAPPAISLDSLATAGMSRPLALLKSAVLTNARARLRHEALAATITLVDRLVTDAGALRLLVSSTSSAQLRQSLVRVADACARTRQALAERRWPRSGEIAARSGPADLDVAALPPLADMERTLEQLSLAASLGSATPAAKKTRPRLWVPDATTNPEYVRFAVKGALAALICYILFVGFDYPGIYTSVVTCFVVSLSTIGSSNQKGLLRFGGAALGGAMGVVALVYVFPNVEGLGGFWLVFAAGTAVAAWINFGSPRISYGGYQTGLAFYKATLQNFGPAVSATVVRDRLIGVAFGLIVFGLVEHLLWPVRAADRMHGRLADVFRSLAALARVVSRPRDDGGNPDAKRDLISQQVADVQGFIESSKFEPGAAAADARAVERLTADAQTVFLVLLAIARDAESAAVRSDAVRAATIRADEDAAAILDRLADRVQPGGGGPAIEVAGALATFERSIAAQIDAVGEDATYAGLLALYRELAVAVNRVVIPVGLTPLAEPARE
jgi:multidrug resistance protein MdtO